MKTFTIYRAYYKGNKSRFTDLAGEVVSMTSWGLSLYDIECRIRDAFDIPFITDIFVKRVVKL